VPRRQPRHQFSGIAASRRARQILGQAPREEERLDYLFRRTDVQHERLLNGEERDFLMLYIAGVLRASGPRNELGIAGWRKQLDEAYLRPLEGRRATRYQRKYTLLWEHLIEAGRSSAYHYWPEAAMILLAFTYDEQVRLEKQVRRNAYEPTKSIGRIVTAQEWGEKFLVAFKAVVASDSTATLDKLRTHLLDALRNRRGDHALIVLLDAGSLKLLDIVILTNHQEPQWR